MTRSLRYIYGCAALSTLVGLALFILPIPDSWATWRVAWPQLVVVYWCLALPQHLGIRYAWITGLCIDLLNQDILGQNALCCVVLAYTAIAMRQFVLYLSMWLQAFLIGMMLTVPVALSVWFEAVIYDSALSWRPWGTVVSSLCVWPWVFAVLRRVRLMIPMTAT